MFYGNLTVIFLVLSVVTCVLGIGYAAVYRLDKTVDPGDR
jgi:hypothetical protein